MQFRLSETPCFFPQFLLERMANNGKELIRQLVDSVEYRARSNVSIPAEFRVPNEPEHPMFVQVDFGLVRDTSGNLQPKLVELQAFPSLYAYQVTLAQSYVEVFELDRLEGGKPLQFFLSGLDEKSYRELLHQAIVGTHDPENVILMEIHPREQKTLPDFLLTEKMLGVRTVDIQTIKKQGSQLYYERNGSLVPIRRIYNRAIVDELQRRKVKLAFDWRDDLDVEWAGHPNWYFRISKFSIPYLRHKSVPKTWFLDRLEQVPDDAIPAEKRGEYILQERLNFEPVIETPFGGTKAEVRVMYVWQEELQAVLTIIRMGRGLMMGVDHNKNMEWVGASAGLYTRE